LLCDINISKVILANDKVWKASWLHPLSFDGTVIGKFATSGIQILQPDSSVLYRLLLDFKFFLLNFILSIDLRPVSLSVSSRSFGHRYHRIWSVDSLPNIVWYLYFLLICSVFL
jgi:hypothetical protein